MAARETEIARYEAASGVVCRLVGDETVLVNLEAELYYSLDPIGTMMWEGLTTGQAVDRLAEELAAKFDVEAEVVRADAEELAAELVEAGLLSAIA